MSSAVRESRLEATLKVTEEERDYYKREFELQVMSDLPTDFLQMNS